ncbi:MAG TPA: cyclic pyranopterin monophosphate synthase MoaC [Paenalcaligenes sp.]|nr:cyclic pyranopterin monophosphate synthase MoaC [Paenalcaligenes sp.]
MSTIDTTKQPQLSHLSATGEAQMVDISHKKRSMREATARSTVRLSPKTFKLLSAQENAKGEVLNTARIAGVMAAKRCADLIPMCHPLHLDYVGIHFDIDETAHTITVRATCRCAHTTGVEMEALTACSVAALTIYDMCKAADKGIVIENTQLEFKSGGKSGVWQAQDAAQSTHDHPPVQETP